ncbi:uncharacterized protein C8A04DRAFT_10993 [Dichotomopilus funicola]|uniref:Uncharacterized protein n=1 Tax=Dichotomopilus funicola TaxID=1934379 RepID=A0AAN6V642_9PEZI|nr:hypothetical protein C8A04DRAFT_10993 [Dichotomopilus funicola]
MGWWRSSNHHNQHNRQQSQNHQENHQDPFSRGTIPNLAFPSTVRRGSPVWKPIKNVFPSAPDKLCDALYAHLLVYNYLTSLSPQQPATTSASTSTPGPSTTIPRSATTPAMASADENPATAGLKIPQKAASLLGMGQQLEKQRQEREREQKQTQADYLFKDLPATPSRGSSTSTTDSHAGHAGHVGSGGRNGGVNNHHRHSNSTSTPTASVTSAAAFAMRKELLAGLERCITLLISAMKHHGPHSSHPTSGNGTGLGTEYAESTKSGDYDDEAEEEDEAVGGGVLMRALCEVVRCAEDGISSLAISTSTSATASTATAAGLEPPRSYPPPPGPSKTFTIDIPMSLDDDITDSLEGLRLTHRQVIDLLSPDSDDEEHDDADGDDYDSQQHQHGYGPDDWLDRSSISGVGSAAPSSSSILSHASSSLPLGASALSTPPSSSGTFLGVPSPHNHQRTGAPRSEPEQPTIKPGNNSRSSSSSRRPPKQRTLASLRLQPQFNLDSAGHLLESFREVMLDHLHCVVVREDETVSSMAKDRPFVLLAVLAAASGSRTMQGHSLYDEEFRKVLGLKFVAGGERTMELLQGLVVYMAWYPFHLRPKNRQSTQYLRMVVDIVNDLELDQNPGTDSMDAPLSCQRLDEIRLYLASYFLVTSSASAWNRTPALTYNEYTARCSDLLLHHSPLAGDHILAWQVRLERIVEETSDLRRTQRGHSQSEYQISLMLRGMETQLSEWEARMVREDQAKHSGTSNITCIGTQGHPRGIASHTSIRLVVLYSRVFLSGAPLLKLPSRKLPLACQQNAEAAAGTTFRADPHRLASVIPWLHQLYDFFLSLTPTDFNAFVGVEWRALIMAVILGFRMSFPLPLCPGWDAVAARPVLRFGEYVERLCRMGDGKSAECVVAESNGRTKGDGGGSSSGGSEQPQPQQQPGPVKSMDVLGASKIVLEMVRRKYVKRIAKAEAARAEASAALTALQDQHMSGPAARAQPPSAAQDPATSGCPMMDGSLDPYYPYWDETFNTDLGMGSSSFAPHGAQVGSAGQVGLGPGGTALPNDLWATLTTGWQQEDVDLDIP